MTDARALFAADGPLASQLDGYVPRAVQQDMAEAVAAAIDDRARLLVEAGTGTGKTLAYLVPALASGRRVIISTATRHLQEQVHRHDLPLVRQALAANPRTALLKGRGNYLCLHRMELTEAAGDLRSPKLQAKLRRIREWSAVTRTGDLGEVGDVDDGSPIWPRVSSTTDNCLGTECPAYEQCWVVAARRGAQAADVLVVNHHLLLADLALREEGFGELLPGADAIVLDEAHRLPEIAGQFFGRALSSRQLRDLVRDARSEADAAGGDMPAVTDAIAALAEAETDFAEAIGELRGSIAWADAGVPERAREAAEAIRSTLDELAGALAEVAERAEALAAVGHRAAELGEVCRNLHGEDAEHVRWLERRGSGWLWHATPLDVAAPFQRAMTRHDNAWIFTSATLSVDGRLDYFAGRLGVDGARRLILDSPFDYRNNGLLFVPPAMPMPNEPGFDDAVAERSLALIRASGGGAFVLCTSYRGLNACAERLAAAGIGPLLVQGERGRAELLEAFRAAEDAVLIGTGSFWEGVDVRGRGLRLVIIDRLPFASPSDPVLAARAAAMRERGESPFADYQLPQAVIALKQGVGRLIRDADDRGVLAICDPRLVSKGYGRTFRESLPDMPLTRNPDEAERFLRDTVAA